MISKQNQSNFDLATQHKGDVRSVLDFCIENELSLTEIVPAGAVLKDFTTLFVNDDVLNYYEPKETELATGGVYIENECSGIGCMVIGDDFIVEPSDLGIGTMIIETNFNVK